MRADGKAGCGPADPVAHGLDAAQAQTATVPATKAAKRGGAPLPPDTGQKITAGAVVAAGGRMQRRNAGSTRMTPSAIVRLTYFHICG